MPIDLERKGCIDGARKAAGEALFCFIDCKAGGTHEQWEPLRFTYKALSAVVLTEWVYCKL